MIEIICPQCGEVYETPYRASFNLDLDPSFDEDYIEDMSSGTCPSCSHRVSLGALVVERDGR
jgi:DNA-directed RNA polymerase subunit RPC12/RpoP